MKLLAIQHTSDIPVVESGGFCVVRPQVGDCITVSRMPRADRSPQRVVKRRPKDRKAQIARASADAFSAMGYHAVGMEDIAAAVGISAAALYRHASSKYDLFRDAVLGLGQQLVDCTEFADDAPDGSFCAGPRARGNTPLAESAGSVVGGSLARGTTPLAESAGSVSGGSLARGTTPLAESAGADPANLLEQLVSALIDTAIANRASGGLYRWEGRYLHGDDQVQLMEQMKLVNRRLQRPLLLARPDLSSRDRWTLSAATLSVIGSIADHRAQLPIPEIREVLAELATATLAAQLPSGVPSVPVPVPASAADGQIPSEAGRYEGLLRASMLLFNEKGYRETSMEDIAAQVGMPASGIYRYFTSKADMLAASFRRAADRVSGDLADIIAAQHDPAQAMSRLIAAYVARSFDDPELAYVYYTERVNLPPGDQVILRSIQRSTVESWVRLLVAARPELTAARARFAVHASFALVVDLGRLVQYENTEESRACVRRMMEVTLLGQLTEIAVN